MNRCAPDGVRAELERILGSGVFDASPRNRKFLRYVVEETLAGRGERIKAYTIATSVFGRQTDFNPQQDPIVRIEAGRLRRALDRFYLMAGRGEGVRITMPRGSYAVAFVADAHQAPHDPARPADGRGPAILVRPFDDEGSHADHPNFARGLARQVIVGLTRYTDLFVYGAETAMPGEACGAGIAPDFLLTGAASLGPDFFRADVLLTEARTGRCVWGESFARQLDTAEILRVRDEVASAVVCHLAQPYGALYAYKAREVEGKPGGSMTLPVSLRMAAGLRAFPDHP